MELKNSLSLLPALENILSVFNSEYLVIDNEKIKELVSFASIIDKTIDENAPVTLKEGNLIKQGVSGELDYYKDLLENGEDWLKKFEEKFELV